MSAEIIPMPVPKEELPPNVTPMPTPHQRAMDKLVKNPLLLAGGALLAGLALSRLWSVPSVRKLGEDLAKEALRKARADDAAPEKAATLMDQAVEALRPQMAEAAKALLNKVLKKN
jgi:hypothetical protein